MTREKWVNNARATVFICHFVFVVLEIVSNRSWNRSKGLLSITF